MATTKITNLDRKEIYEVLSQLGFLDKDREIYLALLRTGSATITPLARSINLPVTTVQSVLRRLVERGIVDVTKRKSRQIYEANDPVVLRRLLERQIEQVAGIIPFLQSMKADTGVAPKIKIYVRDRINDIFYQSLTTKNKLVYEVVAAKELQEVIGEKLHYTRRRLANGVRLKSLRVESREIKKYSLQSHIRELREAKFLPREMTFRSSFMFWDDTVAFVTPKEEGLAWTVESRAFRETVQQMFEVLWDISRPMETANESVLKVTKK